MTKFAVFLILLLTSLSDASPRAICFLTASNRSIHMPSLREDYLFWGHELAAQDFSKNHGNRIELKKLATDGSDLSLLSQAKRLQAEGCVAVTGLSTSRETLLVAQELEKQSVPGVSISGSHRDLGRWAHILRSGTPNSDTYVRFIGEWLNQQKPGRIIILNSRDDLYSNHYTDSLSKIIGSKLQVVSFDSGAGIPTSVFEGLNPNEKVALVFSTYALPSVPILKQVSRYQGNLKNAFVVGSPAWSFDLATFRSRKELFRSDLRYVFPDVWERTSPQAVEYRKRFRMRHGTHAEADSAFAYDLTTDMFACASDNKADVNSSKRASGFIQCLSMRPHSGVSGHYRYSRDSVFSDRSLRMRDMLPFLGEDF